VVLRHGLEALGRLEGLKRILQVNLSEELFVKHFKPHLQINIWFDEVHFGPVSTNNTGSDVLIIKSLGLDSDEVCERIKNSSKFNGFCNQLLVPETVCEKGVCLLISHLQMQDERQKAISMKGIVRMVQSLKGLGKERNFKNKFFWEKSWRVILDHQILSLYAF
jgi:hypothetical protein